MTVLRPWHLIVLSVDYKSKLLHQKFFCGLYFDFSQETIQKVSKDGRVHNILERKLLGNKEPRANIPPVWYLAHLFLKKIYKMTRDCLWFLNFFLFCLPAFVRFTSSSGTQKPNPKFCNRLTMIISFFTVSNSLYNW